jgi:hypothetical protein
MISNIGEDKVVVAFGIRGQTRLLRGVRRLDLVFHWGNMILQAIPARRIDAKSESLGRSKYLISDSESLPSFRLLDFKRNNITDRWWKCGVLMWFHLLCWSRCRYERCHFWITIEGIKTHSVCYSCSLHKKIRLGWMPLNPVWAQCNDWGDASTEWHGRNHRIKWEHSMVRRRRGAHCGDSGGIRRRRQERQEGANVRYILKRGENFHLHTWSRLTNSSTKSEFNIDGENDFGLKKIELWEQRPFSQIPISSHFQFQLQINSNFDLTWSDMI